MTTNNYFGFTHGTQYSAAPGTTYPTQQTGYSVAPGATAAAYPAQRTATGYETYQTQATPTAYAVPAGATTATTYDYGYARTAHSTPTAYDAKAYYQQQATPTTPVTPAYSTSDYQTAGAAIVKPQYSATYSTQTAQQRTVVPPKPAVSAVQYSQYATPQQQQQQAAQPVSSYTPSYSTPATIQPTAPLNKAIGSAPRAITQRAPQQAVQAQTTGYQYTQRHPFKPQQQQQPAAQQVQQLTQLQQQQIQQQQQHQQQQQQIKKTYQPTQVSNIGSYQVNNTATAQAAFVAQSTAAATNTNYNKPKSTGYDTALFNAASQYITQQSGPTQNKPFYKKNFGSPGLKNLRPKAPPKSQQLHYCEVCKISCAGPLTYREHLEGQKHKKKEAAAKCDAPTPTISRGPISLHCDLCAVTCTGQDAYGAHIRGNKHQKVLKLHAMLGKPVPDIPEDPKILVAKTIAAAKANQNSTDKKTVVVPPKVNFVQSGSLSTTTKPNDSKENAAKSNVKSDSNFEPKTEDIEMAAATLLENEVTPVGHEFVEEIKDGLGKLVSFNCKLCECKFNDPNAKEMHMKGRRHRLAFKKKVNPNLQVDIKPSFKHKKGFEEKNRRSGGGGGGPREEFMRRDQRHWQDRMMEVEERMYWDERRRFEEEMEYFDWCRRSHGPGMMPPPPFPPGPGPRMMGPPFMPPPPPPQFQRRLDTPDDRHVIARHAAVYPNEQELKALQKIVSHTEKALKLVSDILTENAQAASDKKNGTAETKVEVKTEAKPETPAKPTPNKKGQQKNKEDGRDGSLFSFEKETETRVLKGVMRVESLAKGLLLHGDTQVKLVVLCSEKPTRQLLVKVAANLTPQLQIVAPEDAYVINMKSEEATITVQTKTEPKLTVSVILTSPLLREQVNTTKPGESGDAPAAQSTPDPPDLLNKKKCLDALAALRHAKWFQARVAGMQNCLMIIRIFRDLCQRVPTWAPFSPWAMELLCEKALTSAGMPLSPGDSLRRVLETVSSGILLQNGPGIMDPCEKDPADAAANLTPQQREDITASAQHALRLLAFRQIHKVLGMEPLPAPPPMPPNKFNNRGAYRYGRKRRRDNSSGENTDSDAGVGEKKDKKDTDVVIKVEPGKAGTTATENKTAAANAVKTPAATAAAAKGSQKSPAAAKPAAKK